MITRRHTTIAAGVVSLAIASPVVAQAAPPLPGVPSPVIHDEGIADVFPAARKERRSEPAIHTTYRRLYAKVARTGVDDPGRNIVEDGVRRGEKVRPARKAEVARSVRTLKKMLGVGGSASTAASSGQGAPATKAGGSSKASPALEAIAACESGGNPGAVGGGGQFRGKYQFDRQTWASVGGSGDPAAASEAEQDARAAQLYAQQGASAWPTCGQ